VRSIPASLAVGAALVLASCGGGGSPQQTRSPLPSGALGVVTPAAARTAVVTLCDLRTATDLDAASARFYDDAHQTLHVIAAVAQVRDRSAAASLLATKQRVEADLEASSLPAAFGADVGALAVATTEALDAIGLPVEGCEGG
jgi:hypothetical protein